MNSRIKIHEQCNMCDGHGIDFATEHEEFPDSCKWCEGKGWIHFHYSDDPYYDGIYDDNDEDDDESKETT